MVFEAFRGEAEQLIREAAKQIGYPVERIILEEPPRPEFGDLSSTIAFDIAKQLGRGPMEVAEKLSSKMVNFDRSLVSEVTVTSPGYLNFRLNRPKFCIMTLKKAIEGQLGVVDIGKGKKVVVEHTSVNPNKALHIGHLRNVIIGDVVQRLLKYTNHQVVVLNYIDDSGLQVADIIVGFKFLGFPEDPPDPRIKFDHYCGDHVYVKVNQIYSDKPETEKYRRIVLKELEDHNSETYIYAKKVTEKVLLEQLETCSNIGAFYDCLNFESDITASKIWQKVFQQMKDLQIIVYEKEGKNAGCWVIKGADDQDKVLIRSDGTATYIAKDIPYAAWKLGLVDDFFNYQRFMVQKNGKVLWKTTLSEGEKDHPIFNNADVAINVIDVRQGRLQKIIANILKKFGEKGRQKDYIHLGYEIVSLSRDTAIEMGLKVEGKDFIHMSGRSGIYINADDVLERLEKLAFQETSQRNPDADPGWIQEIAKSIAVSAIRYGLIKQDFGKILVFDLKEALKLEGETGPYLQYTYARASRILEKHGETVATIEEVDGVFEQEEYKLIKELSKFKIIIKDTTARLEPNKLAEYAHDICLLFNTFYEKYPVLHEQDKIKREQRLLLVMGFLNVLKDLMLILGIEAHSRI